MNFLRAFNLCFLFIGLIFSGCVKDDGDQTKVDVGYDYYPGKISTYITYKVDSVFHDHPDPEIPGIHDTSSFYLKQVIESEFIDNAGRPSLRIENYKKQHIDSTFVITDVWFAIKTAEKLEFVEENRRFIKLAFPVHENKNWNGNALNNLPEWNYHYEFIEEEVEVNAINFPQSLKVLQRENINAVEDENAYEIYSRGVGLIERYYKDLDTRINYQNNPVALNIRLGVEYHWKIIDYGEE